MKKVLLYIGAAFVALLIIVAIDRQRRPEYYAEQDRIRKEKSAAQEIARAERKAESDKAEAEKEKLKSYGDSVDARVMARKFVRNVLKSPSSAEFSEESATLHAPVWWVVGSVDSQNGFGAMVRSKFQCQIQRVSGDTWKLTAPCELLSR